MNETKRFHQAVKLKRMSSKYYKINNKKVFQSLSITINKSRGPLLLHKGVLLCFLLLLHLLFKGCVCRALLFPVPFLHLHMKSGSLQALKSIQNCSQTAFRRNGFSVMDTVLNDRLFSYS